MMAQIQRNNAPNPELEMLKGYNKSIIDWHLNPNNTVKDIAKHPTIGGKLPTYQLAKSFRDKGRIGRGIAGLGGKNDAAYSKDLEQQTDFERGITASGMLETGLQNELDQSASNLAQLEAQDEQRRSSSNSLIQYYHSDLNRRIASGGWGGFLRGLASTVIPIGASILTGGLSGMLSGGGASAQPRQSSAGVQG